METRVLMLATTAAMIEQFNKLNIELLNELGVTVDIMGNFDKGNPISDERLDCFKSWVETRGGKTYNYSANRNPFDFKNNFLAFKKALKISQNTSYAFIHCHNPMGAVIGRLIGKKTNTKVIYTAHGFHFYKGAPIINWLIYFPVEWILSKYTNTIITINHEDFYRANKYFKACKNVYIPGVGLNTSVNNTILVSEEIRKENGIQPTDTVLLSVGELNKNKNHEIVIKAMAKIKCKNIYYIIVGKGNLEEHLIKLAQRERISNQVKIVGFKSNISEYYSIADVFILPSKREGLSVSLMEAMAHGLPCIVSKIRGNIDLIDENKGGFYFDESSIQDLSEKIISIQEYKEDFGTYNVTKIQEYSINNIKQKLRLVYTDALCN